MSTSSAHKWLFENPSAYSGILVGHPVLPGFFGFSGSVVMPKYKALTWFGYQERFHGTIPEWFTDLYNLDQLE